MSRKEKEPKSRRGRPRTIDPREVSLLALELFEREGFDQVTMEAVAEEASISRRTLFRLFPSKADLLWDGVWEVLELMQERVKGLPAGGISLGTLIEQLFLPSLERLEEPKRADWARRRLKLIAASPSLFDHPALHESRKVFADLIRECVVPQKAPPDLLAGNLVAVGLTTILWWAMDEEHQVSAKEALQTALLALGDIQPTKSG